MTSSRCARCARVPFKREVASEQQSSALYAGERQLPRKCGARSRGLLGCGVAPRRLDDHLEVQPQWANGSPSLCAKYAQGPGARVDVTLCVSADRHDGLPSSFCLAV